MGHHTGPGPQVLSLLDISGIIRIQYTSRRQTQVDSSGQKIFTKSFEGLPLEARHAVSPTSEALYDSIVLSVQPWELVTLKYAMVS